MFPSRLYQGSVGRRHYEHEHVVRSMCFDTSTMPAMKTVAFKPNASAALSFTLLISSIIELSVDTNSSTARRVITFATTAQSYSSTKSKRTATMASIASTASAPKTALSTAAFASTNATTPRARSRFSSVSG